MSQPPALPERTVSGKPVDEMAFSDPQGPPAAFDLRHAWIHGDGVLVCLADRLVRFRQEDGFRQCAWPPPGEAFPIRGVALHGDTLLVCGESELLALFAQTLALQWRIALADTAPLSAPASPVLLGPDPLGACLLFGSSEGWEAVRVPVAGPQSSPPNRWTRRGLALPQAPADVAGMGDRLLVAAQQALYVFDWQDDTPAAKADLGHALDRLWPSPDGRHLLATADGGPRVSLLRLEPEALPPTRRLEGMYVPPKAERAGGWLFWDVEDPKVAGAKPLSRPAVAWLDDGRAAVLATAEAEAILILPTVPSAVKLMVPPDEPLYPLMFVPPDRLLALQDAALRTLVLDWEFGEPAPHAPTAQAPPAEAAAPVPGDEPAHDERLLHRPPPVWLLPAALLAAGLAFGLLRWLQA